MSTLFRNFFIFLLGLLIIAGVLSNVRFDNKTAERVDIAKLVQEIKAGEVTRIEIRGDLLFVDLKAGAKQTVQKEPGESLSSLLKNYGVEAAQLQAVETTVKRQSGFGYWIGAFLPF